MIFIIFALLVFVLNYVYGLISPFEFILTGNLLFIWLIADIRLKELKRLNKKEIGVS